MGGGICNFDYNVCMQCKCFNVKCISCYASTPFPKSQNIIHIMTKIVVVKVLFGNSFLFLFNLANFLFVTMSVAVSY